jgi:hypothetical protein
MIELPQHYLFELSAPVVLHNQELYLQCRKNSDSWLEERGKRTFLKKYGTLNDLHKLWLAHNADIIRNYKRSIASEILRNQKQKQKKELNELKAENAILNLIVKDLLPSIRAEDDQYKVNSEFEGTIELLETCANPKSNILIERIIANIEIEPGTIANELTEILVSDRVYSLQSGDDFGPVTIQIAGNTYHPVFLEGISFLKKHHAEQITKQLKLEAVRDELSGSVELQQLAEERKALAKIMNSSKWQNHGAGFIRSSRGYYVYIETPEYVLKDPEQGNYYHFGKAKIGVELCCENGNIFVDCPVVLNSYKHPYLPHFDEKQYICLGDYRYERVQRQQPQTAALQFLFDAKRKLMFVYAGPGGHHLLSDYTFNDLRITSSEIKRRNLPVTNENVANRRVRHHDRYERW